jgi:putative hydrolase of the HAD superfamily
MESKGIYKRSLMITTVIFDLGGVLLRTEDRQPRTRLASKFNLSYEELESLVYDGDSSRQAMRGQIQAQEHKAEVMNNLNLPPDDFQEFGDQFWEGDRMDRKLVDFLRDLKGSYTTALLSNAWDDLRPLLVDYWKISDAFDHIFISAEMGLAKPDPEIYQQVISELGAHPSEVVFVDDFIENVRAAREAGWNAVHFRSREGALIELAEYLDNEL